MAISDNFEKLKKFKAWKNRDFKIKQDIVKSVKADTSFIDDYSAFKRDLITRLDTLFNELGYKEIVIRPHSMKAKYFEAFRKDEAIQTIYKVHVAKGGEYSFRQIELEPDFDNE